MTIPAHTRRACNHRGEHGEKQIELIPSVPRRGRVSYTPAAGRSHIFPPQQPLLPLAMSHLPSLQQLPSLPQHDILPSLPSLLPAIIGHFIPPLLSLDIISSCDIMASLPSLDIWPHLPSLPQQDILPSALS